MEFFDQYTSNSLAGSGNQLFFNMEEGEVLTGRILYKITSSGEHHYSLLFSNIIDSTYSNGIISHANLICDSWTIHHARIGLCKEIPANKAVPLLTMADNAENSDANILIHDFVPITFNGQACKIVSPGEFFSSDPITIGFNQDEYLCLEISFSGKTIPYHEESLLPVFLKTENGWQYSKHMPLAGMIGCDRKVKKRIAFLGDSITQGIGTELNSYLHWNALLSKKLGNEYAFWNLGLGFGRASDAASDGAWLYKAKQNDIVFVCYGVNDLLQGSTAEQIKMDLLKIVQLLKANVQTVILQTIPPFDYDIETRKKWEDVKSYIKADLDQTVDFVFDNVPFLCKDASSPHLAEYGGHPNELGCAAWADALYKEIQHLF